MTTFPVANDAASVYFHYGTVENNTMNTPPSPWQLGFPGVNGFNGLQPMGTVWNAENASAGPQPAQQCSPATTGTEQQETREEQEQSCEEHEYDDLLSFAKWLVPNPGSAWTWFP